MFVTGARLRLCAIALIICIAPTGFAADLSATDVRNFDRVNDLLLRGGEPGAVGLQQIGALGVKVVIDLRESGAATEVEKQQVERLHMKYINVPLRPFLRLAQHRSSRCSRCFCSLARGRYFYIAAVGKIGRERWLPVIEFSMTAGTMFVPSVKQNNMA